MGAHDSRDLQIPSPLKKGDWVALVSPARWLTDERFLPAEAWLESLGLKAVRAPHWNSRQGQLAGTDAERASDLQWALDHPEVRAIWCARGGYGSARMVDLVDWTALTRNPKWIIGYSDPTVLLMSAWNTGVASVHATMPANVATNTADAMGSLEAVLFGTWRNRRWEVGRPAGAAGAAWREGVAQGPLVGGNLSVLYSLLGSKTFPDLRGCILFLEDLDEYVYHIDRMMVGLRRAGVLDGVVGVIVGGFTDIHDHAVPFGREVLEVVLEQFDGIPVACGFPMGHIDGNEAFVVGSTLKLEIDKNAAVAFLVD